MNKFFVSCLLLLGFSYVANADVWSWQDAAGRTHYVDTLKSIYTWRDESGDVHYSDTPDHEDAVAVQLVWHSSGTLDDIDGSADDADGFLPGETPDERAERQQAEAYYCKRATEIYDSYVNAPRLYRTNESGEREYLNEEDAKKMLAETAARKKELCE
jgi:hypothetical protein